MIYLKFLVILIKISVSFFYIFPKFHPSIEAKPKSFSFGSYSFNKLIFSQVRRLCRSAGSDYFERYETYLRSRFMFYREFRDISIINWFPYRENKLVEFGYFPVKLITFNELGEYYFFNLHRVLGDIFLDEMVQQQHLFIALNSPYIGNQPLRLMPNSETLVIFQNVDGKGENGFVSPQSKASLIIEMGELDKSIPKIQKDLKTEYHFSGFLDIPIHKTMQNYVSFIAKAKLHRENNHNDDAYLHFVISLDLVFGEANQSTESVSSRVAAITYFKNSVTFRDQQKLIKGIYSERSKYVHEGKAIKEKSLKQVENICNEVLLCMLRLQKDERKRSDLKLESWLIILIL